MHNVFLYDNRLDLGTGQFATVGGFKLIAAGYGECPEAIIDKDNKIYGYIYKIKDDILDMLDTYYGLGLKLHNRISVEATLLGGVKLNTYMYEYNMESTLQ